MPDWNSWTPYIQSGLALTAGWLVKSQIQTGKDVITLQTVMKYYVERQTQDAAERLNKGNPAPPHILTLVNKHIAQSELTENERQTLTDWLRWTGKGDNPDADSAERSAALQLLTGIRTLPLLEKPKRRWWQFA